MKPLVLALILGGIVGAGVFLGLVTQRPAEIDRERCRAHGGEPENPRERRLAASPAGCLDAAAAIR